MVKPLFDALDSLIPRHIGPADDDRREMLDILGYASMDGLIAATVPGDIRLKRELDLPRALTESEALAELAGIARKNRVARSFIGMGYYGTLTPGVILRNVLENPAWYTAYTPYQAEIAQGRLEALFLYQTMVAELTGLPVAGASLLDEATAAAEAMTLCHSAAKGKRRGFYVDENTHPQTLAVIRLRAEPYAIEVHVGPADGFDVAGQDLFGALLSYPGSDGRLADPSAAIAKLHAGGALAVVATDLLALTLIKPPGELGADVAIGSSQRFGVPMGFGGPHAAFFATNEEHKRQMPGRIIGLSKDSAGQPAYRMALQTREQHIRREKATSNICTAQVLLAVIAGLYAAYHGPEGLRRIGLRVRGFALLIVEALRRLGYDVDTAAVFDTLRVRTASPAEAERLRVRLAEFGVNVRVFGDGSLGISCDETTSRADAATLIAVFGEGRPRGVDLAALEDEIEPSLSGPLARTSTYLHDRRFQAYHAEHEMLRFIRALESKDLSMVHSMISLGSCTMKLNATSEMLPVTWPELGAMHPFAPAAQTLGYQELFRTLERWLAEITGFPAISLQPNAGSQGEYAGLLVIRSYHRSRGDSGRDVCLIPTSAHGTNPASAAMAGLRVVAVACDARGNVDLADLEAKADQHRERLAALMITYPSTHGVFETEIRRICQIVHERGGQVYMDGANMNAQVGLCRPGDIGADVCHLNLHKTFCIPHGGGGPGMGPIGVASHLAPFLPGHPVVGLGGERAIGPVAAAPFGSPSILAISWMYIRMMGGPGLRLATETAILSANYMAARLAPHYPVLYSGQNGRVAHEFILDLRPLKDSTGVAAEDVAKRLMDYGFHAPTMSFPVAGTLMIEPTESESRAELDRFVDALIAIRDEIRKVEDGSWSADDNPLKHAPHTAAAVAADGWNHPYSRELAAWPRPWVKDRKFWPAVGRIDNVWGDRNLICTCPSVEEMAEAMAK